jgi:hypothetical protein
MSACVYCGGRLVVLEAERFIEFDAPQGAGGWPEPFTDLEPIQPGDVCCSGPETAGTSQAAYDRACGYFD